MRKTSPEAMVRHLRKSIRGIMNVHDDLGEAYEMAKELGMAGLAKDIADYQDEVMDFGPGLDMVKSRAAAAVARQQGDAGADPDMFLSDGDKKDGTKGLKEARHAFNLGFKGDGKTGGGPQISGFGRDVPILMSLSEVYETEDLDESDHEEDEDKNESS